MAEEVSSTIPRVVMNEINRVNPEYGVVFRIGLDRSEDLVRDNAYWLGYIINRYMAVSTDTM